MQKEGFDYDYVFDWTLVDKVDRPIQNAIERKQFAGVGSMAAN